MQLLSKRGKYDAALELLDELAAGRSFDADLAYERITVLEAMEKPVEVRDIAAALIENGYASLQSYLLQRAFRIFVGVTMMRHAISFNQGAGVLASEFDST